MKVIFISNYFNHHQSAISDALWKKTGGNYTFIASSAVPSARRQLGYGELEREYVLRYRGNEAEALRRIREADVVIAGSAPEELVRERIRSGKLLFRYAERPLKNGPELHKYFPRLLRWHWRNPMCRPIHLLCASAYTAGDYAKFGLFRNRAYRWGYFPETKRYADVGKLMAEKDPARILWCGRFLKLKHPDDALAAAKRLREEGYHFRLDLIGCGAMEEMLRQLVKQWDMEDCVRFLGSMRPEAVREQMETAGIYLFTSDRQEGWGAVLNESMNSGCAVVASHAIGSVPFLVRDGGNGLVYESGNVDMLYEKIKYLLERPEEQRRLGAAAYRTIAESWNADTAADRLLALSEKLLAGEKNVKLFADGPCSGAKAEKERHYTQ